MASLLLAFACAGSAKAQSWTAAPVQAGYFVLYNVGTGQYFSRGNGWGTQASNGGEFAALPVELKAEGSNWFIRTAVNDANYGLENLNGGTCYTDQSRGKKSSWTFTQVSTDNGPVYNIVSADNHGGGAGAYLTAGMGDNGTIVGPGTDGSAANAQWKLKVNYTSADKLNLSGASQENPIDVTALIGGANFGGPAVNGFWTMDANNKNLYGGDQAANPCAESWQSAFTLSQKLTGLPAGVYVLRAKAALTDYTNAYDGANYPVVYANEASSPFVNMEEADRGTSMTQLGASFVAGKYEVAPISVIVTNGELTIGVRGTRTNTWCIWDDFRLEFRGIDLNTLVAVYNQTLNSANALSGDMNTDVAGALAVAITQNSSVDQTSEDALTAAIDALNTAIAAAQTSIDEYAKIKAYLTANASTAGVSGLQPDYDNGSYTTYVDFLPKAQQAIVNNIAEADHQDITALILNNCPTSNKDFWDGDTSNAFDPGNNVAEFWSMAGASMSQTLPMLPEGTYILKVRAITRDDCEATISASTGESAFIEGVPRSVCNTRTMVKDYFAADPNNGLNIGRSRRNDLRCRSP